MTLGWLLGAVTPPGWLKLGIIAMSAADVWLVPPTCCRRPTTRSSPPPRCRAAACRSCRASCSGPSRSGYGDLFVAGLLGAVLAREGGRQWRDGAAHAACWRGLFDLLFFVLNELPATVPVALALIVGEVWVWRRAPAGAQSRPRAAQGPEAPVEAATG